MYRKKYEGKYPRQPPTAYFKGNYGTRTDTAEQEKEAAVKAFADKEQMDAISPIEPTAHGEETSGAGIALFKKKSVSIAKVAGMSSRKSNMEQRRLREEKERQLEAFRQKREKIEKEKANRRKMSLKMNKIQLELFGEKPKEDEELSVSSGDGEVFVHNLMGFWT